jgi:nucleoside-diphosphate-sugar epimerase
VQFDPTSRILITGATGWLGRETICLLQEFSGSLTLAASGHNNFSIHGREFQTIPLSKVEGNSCYDYIFHYSFLTQDKFNLLGSKRYIDANRQITNKIYEIARANPSAKTLVLSSGAVAAYQTNTIDTEAKIEYAKLKLELESMFENQQSLVLRLWSTTGHHLGFNPNYAISEFVNCALKNEEIVIRNNVSRSYVASQEIISSAINYMQSGYSGIINSGGDKISLLELAEEIKLFLNSTSSIINLGSDKSNPSEYISPKCEIPEIFRRTPVSLRDQIDEIARGIRESA